MTDEEVAEGILGHFRSGPAMTPPLLADNPSPVTGLTMADVFSSYASDPRTVDYPYHYDLYGGRLSSTMPFPELTSSAADRPATWTVRVVEDLPAMSDPVLLGEELIYGDVSASLYRHAHGHRIHVPDTGSFQLDENGRHIAWCPNSDPWWDFGRGHILGRVLATSLHLDGVPTLHGSAVEMKEGVIAFLAPKYHGKSTLALELMKAGAGLVTDDSLALRLHQPVCAFPGVHSIRLRSAEEGHGQVESTGRDGKFRLTDIAAERRTLTPRPLSMLYVLQPLMPNAEAPAVARTPLEGPLSLMHLLPHAKIGQMLGAGAAATLLAQLAELTSRVPAARLMIVRDRERLDDVVRQLIEWHGLPHP